MPILKEFDLNGFKFTLTTFTSKLEAMINIGDERIAKAIKVNDPAFYSALEKLSTDFDEIKSVLLAEESLSMWFQSFYANNRQNELQRILNSVYASDELKQEIRIELGYISRPSKDISPIEWYAMMHGSYQAMPESEKEELHNWEQTNIDGSGKFSTSDWPGWEKYIGKKPTSLPSPVRRIKEGYIYLIKAKTGEYKIGYSADVNNRIKAFSVQPPFDYELLHYFPADDMGQAETILHNKFSDKRIRGEWFSLTIVDIEWIMQIIGFENGEFVVNIE